MEWPPAVRISENHSLDLTHPIEVDGGGSPEADGNDHDDGSPETVESMTVIIMRKICRREKMMRILILPA